MDIKELGGITRMYWYYYCARTFIMILLGDRHTKNLNSMLAGVGGPGEERFFMDKRFLY